MPVTGQNAYLWKAKTATIKVLTSAIGTVQTTASLSSQFSGATGALAGVQAFAKNVTIKPPMAEVDKEDFLGVDADGFQNAELNEPPQEMAEASGTLVLDSDEVLDTAIWGTGTTTATNYTRYRPILANRPKMAFLLQLTVPSGGAGAGTNKERSFVLNNGFATFGELKLADASGHFEIDFKVKCLPRDYYEEVRN